MNCVDQWREQQEEALIACSLFAGCTVFGMYSTVFRMYTNLYSTVSRTTHRLYIVCRLYSFWDVQYSFQDVH